MLRVDIENAKEKKPVGQLVLSTEGVLRALEKRN